MHYVLDCSAVINFLVDDGKVRGWVEPLFKAADEGKVKLHAPAYMIVEFLNVITKKTNHPGFDRRDADSCLMRLDNLDIEFHDFTPVDLAEDLVELTCRQNEELKKEAKKRGEKPGYLTIYDAVYFELAQRLKATVVTSDEVDMVRLCKMAGCQCMHPGAPDLL